EEIKRLQLENKQLKLQIQVNGNKSQDNALSFLNDNSNPNQHLQSQVIQGEMEKYRQQLQLKDDEIKKIQRSYQQDVLKLRGDLEMVKKDCVEKETLLCQHDKLLKSLQNKNNELTQNYQKLFDEQKEQTNNESWHSPDHTVQLDSFRTTKLFKTLSGHSSYVWSIEYSRFNRDQYLCSGSHDKTICVWDAHAAKLLKTFTGHSSIVHCLKFSPYHYYSQHNDNRGLILCSASNDKTIRFWNIETGKEILGFSKHAGGVCGIQFSSFCCGRYLCSGSTDSNIHLWDVATSKLLHILNGHTKTICCVEFSPLQNNNKIVDNNHNGIGIIGGSGYTICSGSYDQTIRLWDVETTRPLTVLKGHDSTIWTVKYSRIGTNATICSGSQDKTIRLWDIRTNKDVQIFKGHTNDVNCVEYSPFQSNDVDTIICSGSSDNTICFWDTRTTKQLYEIKGNDGDGGIYCLQFSSFDNQVKTNQSDNGNTNSYCGYSLCYGSRSGNIRLWK
ncbi:G-protein beta WD-40 repeats containing protein, partial [Reticulomyxa filosa]